MAIKWAIAIMAAAPNLLWNHSLRHLCRNAHRRALFDLGLLLLEDDRRGAVGRHAHHLSPSNPLLRMRLIPTVDRLLAGLIQIKQDTQRNVALRDIQDDVLQQGWD